MGHSMAVAALFSSLGFAGGIHLFSNCFLSSYPGLKTGDPKMNQTDGGSLLPDCTDLLLVFETSVGRDHSSSVILSPQVEWVWSEPLALCQPMSALVNAWSTVLCHLPQRIDVKLK